MFMKINVIVFSYLTLIVQAVSSDCVLGKNTFNEYPFMIKMMVDSKTRGLGILIAPKRVISPRAPFADIENNTQLAQLVPKIQFVGQRFGAEGYVDCTDNRQAENFATLADAYYRNFVTWLLKEGFEVSENDPFLFNSLEDISNAQIAKNIEETKDGELCAFPRFEDREQAAKIRVDEVKIVKGEIEEEQRKIHCGKSQSCLDQSRREELIASAEFLLPGAEDHNLWLQGAVVICRGHPLGYLSDVVKTGSKVLVFQTFKVAAGEIRSYGQNWPTKTTTTTTITTTTTTTNNNMKLSSKDSKSKETTRWIPQQSFSIRLIQAPSQTRPPTTTKSLKFIRTLPKKARYQGCRNRSSNTSSLTLYIIAAKLIFL